MRTRTRRRIGLGLVLESGLPTGDEIGQTSGQREDRRGNGKRKREWPSEFGYGLKQVRVRAEHENELTVLVEHERCIREHEKKRKGSGQVVGADGDRTSSEKQ
jgi:hypothetical protein